ncbi:MAG: 50S ribosomal protein L19, partial [Terriglobia bacterium]
MSAIDKVVAPQVRRDLPPFKPGDTIRIHVKIKEGDKERIQPFEGI